MFVQELVREVGDFWDGVVEYMGRNGDKVDGKEVGWMVPMKCGHRGKPNRSEERLIENLVGDSGFLMSAYELRLQ